MNTGGDVMKILVTGVTGQLGYDVARVCRERGMEVVGATRAEMPLTDLAACRSFIEKVRPEAIVHCAAYTAVDRAEDEPALCRAVNASATGAVAETAEAVGAKLIYISTDYVFPGTGETFYETDAEKGPQNVYGASKLAGELAATSAMKSGRLFIVRISWVFGINGNVLKLLGSGSFLHVACAFHSRKSLLQECRGFLLRNLWGDIISPNALYANQHTGY